MFHAGGRGGDRRSGRTGSALACDGGSCSVDLIDKPYNLDTGMTSRSISFENPTGEPGQGGKAASNLGPGRKGSPSRTIKPGETVDLCDIQGPGLHPAHLDDHRCASRRSCVRW